jgi:hypothetical protein
MQRQWAARFVCLLVAVLLVGRPARLESVRWWRSRSVVQMLGLTSEQAQAIDRLYEQHLSLQRRCIEHLVEASNRVDRLVRDGMYTQTLHGTEDLMRAGADERALMRHSHDEIVALLTPPQRRLLARLRPGVVD